MVIYSIKEIEKLCGVKAHTLRIWEKRYGIIAPDRTDTNIRFYRECHLKKILNISFLNRNGLKISKIAQLSDEEMQRKVSVLSSVHVSFEDQLDALVLSLLELDSYNFNKILDQHIKQTGFEKTMIEMVYPLMDKLNIMWLAGSLKTVHEVFMTSSVKAKIIAATEKLDFNKSQSKASVLLYLPNKEDHELSLLFLNFLLKKHEFQVCNMGANVELEQIVEAYEICSPDFIFTIINDTLESGKLSIYLSEIHRQCPQSKILITGRQAAQQRLKDTDYLKVLKSLSDTLSFIQAYAQKKSERA